MPLGFFFWLLMVLWVVLDLYWGYPAAASTPNGVPRFVGGRLLLFALLFLLGWHDFGFVIKQ
jgi:hypothetical protein